MENSIFIAKIIGIVYLSFGVGLLINGDYYREAISKLIDNSSYLLLGGIMAIILGFFIIEYHNKWANDWTVIITIIGWLALIKGFFLIAFPRSFNVFKGLFKSRILTYVLGPIVFLFGLFLSYLGFFS